MLLLRSRPWLQARVSGSRREAEGERTNRRPQVLQCKVQALAGCDCRCWGRFSNARSGPCNLTPVPAAEQRVRLETLAKESHRAGIAALGGLETARALFSAALQGAQLQLPGQGRPEHLTARRSACWPSVALWVASWPPCSRRAAAL